MIGQHGSNPIFYPSTPDGVNTNPSHKHETILMKIIDALVSATTTFISIIRRLFTWPERIEMRWIGHDDETYDAKARLSIVLSFIAAVFALGIACAYAERHGPENGEMAVFYAFNALFDLPIMVAVVILGRSTWISLDNKLPWFLFHGFVIFVGGFVYFMILFFVLLLLLTPIFILNYLKLLLHAGFSSSNAGRIASGGSSSYGNSGSQEDSSGYGVESQDMFNDELKKRNGLGPDSTLTHDESQDSIYGNTYVDNNNGKEYRVTETDAFGHPTKVEEKWL